MLKVKDIICPVCGARMRCRHVEYKRFTDGDGNSEHRLIYMCAGKRKHDLDIEVHDDDGMVFYED